MQLFKRDDVIQSLLSQLDIPRLVMRQSTERGIGPYDPDFFHHYEIRRAARESTAESALLSMTDEDLFELHEVPHRLESFAREHRLFDPPPWHAGGFGVTIHKPDYDHWLRMDYWTLEEATCLSIGFKPEKLPSYSRADLSPFETLKFFKNRLGLFERAHFKGPSAEGTVAPLELIKWALRKKLEIPIELSSFVDDSRSESRPAMLGSVDKRRYDTALKVILGLIANMYGEEQTGLTKELKEDVLKGLALVGLSLDRKTLNKILGEAVAARQGFVEEQKGRDERQG